MRALSLTPCRNFAAHARVRDSVGSRDDPLDRSAQRCHRTIAIPHRHACFGTHQSYQRLTVLRTASALEKRRGFVRSVERFCWAAQRKEGLRQGRERDRP